jgi:hypothetical protein
MSVVIIVLDLGDSTWWVSYLWRVATYIMLQLMFWKHAKWETWHEGWVNILILKILTRNHWKRNLKMERKYCLNFCHAFCCWLLLSREGEWGLFWFSIGEDLTVDTMEGTQTSLSCLWNKSKVKMGRDIILPLPCRHYFLMLQRRLRWSQ